LPLTSFFVSASLRDFAMNRSSSGSNSYNAAFF
jgi:hypothetical protein